MDDFTPASRAQVLHDAAERYGTQAEYLWQRHPDCAVLRHTRGGKWYGVLMGIPAARLGIAGKECVDVLNVKCGADLVDILLAEPGVYPAWHMNKNHWVSVVLEETDAGTVRELLAQSYRLTMRKTRVRKA